LIMLVLRGQNLKSWLRRLIDITTGIQITI